MSWTEKGTFTAPNTALTDLDWYQADGMGAPWPLVRDANTIELYVAGRGQVGLPLNTTIEQLASSTGVAKAAINNFVNTQTHNSIGVAQFTPSKILAGGDNAQYFEQILRPSYPFDSWATQEVYDPSVILDGSGGRLNDKTCRDSGGNQPSVSNFFNLTVWIYSNKGAQPGDVIAQKGVLWKLYFSSENEVTFTYLNSAGKRLTYGPLPIIVSKNDMTQEVTPSNKAWTGSEDNYGKPVCIMCGPGYLAVSTHDNDPDPLSDPDEHAFIFDANEADGYSARRMLNMQGEPLTLGNTWQGKDDDRFRSGGILGARISYEENALLADAQSSSPSRGFSLMQSTISRGPYLDKTASTTWLINVDSANSPGIVPDTANATALGRSYEPYNIRLLGDTAIKEVFIDDSENPANFELNANPNTNAQSVAYIDVRVPTDAGSPKAFWKDVLGDQTPNGVSVRDDEDDDGLDTSVTIVINTRDRGTQEQLSVFAWEDLGRPSDGRLYGYRFTVHRLYLSSAPTGSYTVPTGERYEYGNTGPFIYQWTGSDQHTYKAIVVDYDAAEVNNANYYTFGWTDIPDPQHERKMFYVGYDGSTYAVMYAPMANFFNISGVSQRGRPVYRSSSRLSAPVPFRFNDDLYVMFTEETGTDLTDDARVRTIFRKINEFDNTLLGIPALEGSGATTAWDKDAVQGGGLYYNEKSRQFTLSYIGYNGSAWQIGKAVLGDLITPVRDNVRSLDAIASPGVDPTYFRGVSPFFKIENDFYGMYTAFDSTTSEYYIGYALYELEDSEVIPGDTFGDYEEEFTDAELADRVRGLHRYYKRNGFKYTIAACGTNFFRGVDSLDELNRLQTSFVGIGKQTDVTAAYAGIDPDIYMETFQDWVYIAHVGDELTRWAGGLIKKVGVTKPANAAVIAINAVAGGDLPDGAYQYKYTYFTNQAESNPSSASNAVTIDALTGKKKIDITWTAPSDPDIVGVVLYRLNPGSTTYVQIATITSTTQTTYTDTGGTDATATGTALQEDHDEPISMVGVTSFNEILVGWNDNRIYWSKANNANYWPTGNVINLETNGEDIQVCKQLGHQLVAFTATKVFAITPVGSQSSDSALIKLSPRLTRASMGTVAPRSVVVAPYQSTNVCFYLGTDRKIWLFNGEDAFPASEKIVRTTRRISRVFMNQAAGAFFDTQYVLCAPFASNVNNNMIVLDLRKGVWSYHTNQHISCFTTFSSQRDGYLLIGGDSRTGNLYQVFDPTQISDDGEPILVRMKTKRYDLGMPETEKRIRKLYYDFRGSSGVANIIVRVEDDTIESSQNAPINGFTFVLKYDPDNVALSLGNTLSTNWKPLSNVFNDTPTGIPVAPRGFTSDGFMGVTIFDDFDVEFDADKFITLPTEMKGKEFSIEIFSADASDDFQIDSLSLQIRAERVR